MSDVADRETELRPVRCLIADDHAALRDGVSAILAANDDIEVVGQAGTSKETLEMIERRRPDVAILDIRLPDADGIATCRQITTGSEPTQVIVYTAFGDRELLDQALDAGARGFVLKTGSPNDLVRAVRTVAQGQPFVDVALTAALLQRRTAGSGQLLTEREREVIQLLADGATTEKAAQELFLSPATVRSYTEKAMQKLEARSRTHAVAQALRAGLID